MHPSELSGKKVVDSKAKIVGTVIDSEIDAATWKVTCLRVELTDEAIGILGYKKPFMGRVEIVLSVYAITAVADVVNLNRQITELKDVIKKPE